MPRIHIVKQSKLGVVSCDCNLCPGEMETVGLCSPMEFHDSTRCSINNQGAQHLRHLRLTYSIQICICTPTHKHIQTHTTYINTQAHIYKTKNIKHRFIFFSVRLEIPSFLLHLFQWTILLVNPPSLPSPTTSGSSHTPALQPSSPVCISPYSAMPTLLRPHISLPLCSIQWNAGLFRTMPA